MRAQPRARQGAAAFDPIDMDFAKAVSVIIPCIFTFGMALGCVYIT
jgi:hypothetical protein